jgi:DNA-binding IclR family transcriptional regulator
LGEDVEASSLYRAILAQDPESRETSRVLAQLLATSQNPTVLDPREARRLATKPVTSGYVLTLAEVETLVVSLAADGDITSAVNVARQGLAAAIRDKDDLMSARFTAFLEKSLVPGSPHLDP